MDMRELFAAHAMQSLIILRREFGDGVQPPIEAIAVAAYRFADAMVQASFGNEELEFVEGKAGE